jgi:hypothetical protein
MKFDRQANENRLAEMTLEVLRRSDARTDAERVSAVLDAWGAGGWGVAGPEATMTALQMGQIDEPLIAASPTALKGVQSMPEYVAPVAAETSASTALRFRI